MNNLIDERSEEFGDVRISSEEKRTLVKFAMSITFDKGKMEMIDKNSYSIRLFQKSLIVGV
jgi:hypothetical protein